MYEEARKYCWFEEGQSFTYQLLNPAGCRKDEEIHAVRSLSINSRDSQDKKSHKPRGAISFAGSSNDIPHSHLL